MFVLSIYQAVERLDTDVQALLLAAEAGDIEVRVQLFREDGKLRLPGPLMVSQADGCTHASDSTFLVPWQAGSAKAFDDAVHAAHNTMVVTPGQGSLSNLCAGEGFISQLEILVDGESAKYLCTYMLNQRVVTERLFVRSDAISEYKARQGSREGSPIFTEAEQANLKKIVDGMQKLWDGLTPPAGPPENQVLALMRQLPEIAPACMRRSRRKGWPNQTYVSEKLEETRIVSRSVAEKLLRKVKRMHQTGR